MEKLNTIQWAVELSEAHPRTSVEGVDISVMQPERVPKNCTFIIDNVEDRWAYTRPFGLIFARNLEPAIEDWPALIKQAAA